MTRIVTKKRLIWTVALLSVIVLLYNFTFYFLQDRMLTTKVNRQLQVNLTRRGINVKVGKIHWVGGGNFEANVICLNKQPEKNPLIEIKRLALKTNIWEWLQNPKNPETVIDEVELIGAHLRLIHTNGNWNITQLFYSKEKGRSKIRMKVAIRDGIVDLDDWHYGKYRVESVNGKVDFTHYPEIRWTGKGCFNWGKGETWQSVGVARIDQKSGHFSVKVQNVPLVKTTIFLPSRYPLTVQSGRTHGTLKFAWNNDDFWMENGHAIVDEGKVKVTQFPDPLQIKTADISFDPRCLTVASSRIIYKRTQAELSGTVDVKRRTVHARMDSTRARVEDLLEPFPAIPDTRITGMARLKLRLEGQVKSPVFSGSVALRDARVVSHGETFTGITGQTVVKKNNITVRHLTGFWDGARIGALGQVRNIYNPRLDLDVVANGVGLAHFNLNQLSGGKFKTNEPADFHGELTGYWDQPRLAGEATLENAHWDEVAFQDVKARFAWEPMCNNRIEVFECGSQIWDRNFHARGLIKIEPSGAIWKMTGEIGDVDITKLDFLPNIGIKEGKVSANVIFKGKWRSGEPFRPGTLMGSVKGEKIVYQNTRVDELSAVYSWTGGALQVNSLQAKVDDGRIFGQVTLGQSSITSTLTAENIHLENVLPDQKLPAIRGDFQGDLVLNGDFHNINAGIDGQIKNLVYAQKNIGDISGKAEYQNETGELKIDDLLLVNETGIYYTSGKAMLKEKIPVLYLNAETDNLKLKGFMDWLGLDQEMKLDGHGKAKLHVNGPFNALQIEGRLDLEDPQIAGFAMQRGILEISGDSNQLHLTQCELSAKNTRISMNGTVQRERLDLNIGGHCEDLQALKLQYAGNDVKGKIDLKGKVEGDFKRPLLTAAITGSDIAYGALRYSTLNANIKWSSPQLEIYDTRLESSDRAIDVNGRIFTGNPVRLDLGCGVEKIPVKELLKLAKLTQVNAEGRFTGNILLAGTLSDPQCRLSGTVNEGAINTIPVSGQVSLFYATNKLTIERIGLEHSTGSFEASGVWEKGKQLQLNGRLDQFPLEAINPFVKAAGLNLAGLVNGDLHLEWSTRAFHGDFTLACAAFQVNKENYGDASVAGSINQNGIYISDGGLNIKKGSLSVHGFIPWSAPAEARLQVVNKQKEADTMDLKVGLKSVSARLLNIYVDGFRVNDGDVDGRLQIKGRMDKPVVDGKIVCDNVQLEVPAIPLSVNAIQATVEIEKNQATITKASANVGGGKVEIRGTADFTDIPHLNLNLDLTGSKVYVKNSLFDGYGDFQVKLAGDWNDPIIMGNVVVNNSKLGGLTLMKNTDTSKNQWNPRIDLMVKLDNKVRYRQIGVADLIINGSIHIKGDLKDPRLGGEVTTKQGVVTFYSQTFKVNRGQAVFSYSEGFTPFVDMEASLVTAKAEVFATLKGQFGTEIAPVLSSRPPLSQKEIFALLNWSDLTGDSPVTLDNVVNGNLSVVTDGLFGDLFFQIGDALHIDYFYVGPDYRTNEYRLSAGDYLTKNLFISYMRSFPFDNEKQGMEKWSFDYHLTSKFALGGTYSPEDGRAFRLTYTVQF